ncbi:MAG: PCRF domain-containing protein, partial [Pseudomonadota bacterium]|nr:PCRF domain-containing protein [Pseudomonadota bacterium]
MLPQAKLDTLIARHAAVEAELSRQLPPETYVKLSREFAELSPLVETVKTYRAVEAELAGLDALMEDPTTDGEMRAIASAEKPELVARRARLEEDIRVHLIPKDAMDERNVIVEIRAGTGGDEATLFAAEMMRMYQRYSERQGWRFEILEASESGIG